MSARTLTKSLGGMWCGHYGLVRCPTHDDRKPSLKIKDDDRKSDGIDVICFAGCDWKAIKTALRQQGLLVDGRDTQRQAAKVLGADEKTNRNDLRNYSAPNAENVRTGSPETKERRASDDVERRTKFALQMWKASVPLPNTLGFKYFTECRGLHIGLLDDLSHALRWHESERAVIALMTDPISNEPIGIHRTFLNPDGTKAQRKMLGKAGVICLSPDESVTEGLAVTEGVEDALSVLLSGWAPVWAASSAGAISKFPVLSGVECLTIFADCEEVGMNAAIACADRWEAAGRDVSIQEQGY